MLLKQPVSVGGLTVKNRLVMPPTYTGKALPDGLVSPELCDYYKQRAGWPGLVITEHSYVTRQGKAGPYQVSAAEDAALPGLRQLAQTLQVNGTRAFVQISHAGSLTTPEITGQQLVSASEAENPGRKVQTQLPRELTAVEICIIRQQFVRAAQRVKAAGFDGVEVHCAHGYLLNEFYSPITNHRTDEYGGCLENRLRLTVEIVRDIRAALGSEFPVAVRLGGCDYMEGGNTIQDAVAACRILESEGVSLLDLSGGMCRYIRKDCTEPGYFAQMTRAVKAEVSVPVLLTGGITTAQQAEGLLQAGDADMIGVARAVMQDADWMRRALTQPE